MDYLTGSGIWTVILIAGTVIGIRCLIGYYFHMSLFVRIVLGRAEPKHAQAIVRKYLGMTDAFQANHYPSIPFPSKKKRFYLYEVSFQEEFAGTDQTASYLRKDMDLSVGEKVEIEYFPGRNGSMVLNQKECIPWLKKRAFFYTVILLFAVIAGNILTFFIAG